jgi:N-formylglutamate amidohydrolase
MESAFWSTEFGDGPLMAVALHDGGRVRPEVAQLLKLDYHQRRREEDPFTGGWTSIAPTHIVVGRSRFEVDMNRPREQAVYRSPADAWGLDLWQSPPPPELVTRSLVVYDDFYAHLRLLVERLVARHGRIVVFDLHSYNHRRQGPDAPPADPIENPDINLGTGTMRRKYWAPVVDRCLAELRAQQHLGQPLHVRENAKFFGGHMAAWLHEQFPDSVCVLAIEVKKFFMDEWTGQLNQAEFDAVGLALRQAAAGAVDALEK